MGRKPTYEELQQRVQGLMEKEPRNDLNLLETLINTIPNPVFYKDKRGIYRGCNQAFADQILGLSKEQIVGCSLFDLPDAIPSDLAQIYHQKDNELIEKPGTQFYESQVQCADGVRRDFLFSKATYTDSQGDVAGMVGTMTDITARKRAEEALIESEERHRLLFENAPLGYQSLDANGHFLEVNQTWLDTLGYTREEVIGKSFGDFLHPDWKNHFKENFPRFKAMGEVLGVEFEMVKKDGSSILLSFTGKIGKDEKGEFKQTHCIFHDVTKQRHAEDALRMSEQRYRSLFEQSNDAVFIHNLHGRILDCNQRAIEMLGYEKEQILNMHIPQIHPEEDLDSSKKAFQEAQKKGYTRFESRFKRSDGTLVDVEISSRVTEPDKGVVQGIVRDISKRKRADKALRESEARYRALFDNMHDGVAIYSSENNGQDFIFIDFNKTGEKIENVKKEDLIGKSVLETFPGVKDFGLFDVLQRVWETGKPEHFPIAFYKDNRISGWRDNYVYKLESGEIVAIYRDETNRKQAEDALRESENRFRLLTTISPAGIYMTDAKGDTIYVNESWCEMAGLSPEEAAGRGWVKAIHPEDSKQISSDWYKIVESDGQWGTEYRFQAPDGKITWVYGIATEMRDENGSIVGYMGTNIDINDRKQMEEEKAKLETQLQQAQKMEAIGTLAGGIAHDFNNILAPIIGCTEMSMEDVSPDTFVYENLQAVLDAGMRAKDLVQQILTFSRQADQELKPLRVQTIIKEVLKLSRSTLPSTIQIQQYISNQCGLVMADATQIHQIAMNLITNAFHAMEESGGKLAVNLKEIELATEDLKDPNMIPGPYVCLTVTDTGYGIEKPVMDRIFDPYFTTKEKEKSTGLGLSVVHGIVKIFGGDIRVQSEPGMGTEFQVYLPVIKTRDEALEKQAMEPVLGGTERILLVDDEDQVVRMVKQMLERLGYQITARTSSIEALEVFQEGPDQFDLIITDMTMPNMTGVQLAQKLIAVRSNIPIIICSGFSEKIDAQKAKVLGISGYVMKPVVRRELAKKVREALN